MNNKTTKRTTRHLPESKTLNAIIHADRRFYTHVVWSLARNMLWELRKLSREEEQQIKALIGKYLLASGFMYGAAATLCMQILKAEERYNDPHDTATVPTPLEWFRFGNSEGVGEPADWQKYYAEDAVLTPMEEWCKGLSEVFLEYTCAPTKENYGIIRDCTSGISDLCWPAKFLIAVLDYHYTIG